MPSTSTRKSSNSRHSGLSGYYPFGMMQEGRQFVGGMGYRYGFGAQESDNEVSGRGNSYTAEFWQYDSRLGRRWNLDPVFCEGISSYAVNNLNPICISDPKGAEGEFKIRGSSNDRKQNRQEKKALRDLVKDARQEMKSWSDGQWANVELVTGRSKSEFKRMFRNGSGPYLKFSDISKGSSSEVRNNRYAHFDGLQNTIVLDETFFKLWLGEKEYQKSGSLPGGFLPPSGLPFKSPEDRAAYAATERIMYRQFFKKTLFHEATHKQESQTNTIGSSFYLDMISTILETSERGELFELTMFGSVSSHHNHGFATFKAFELAQQMGEEQRRVWRKNNEDNLRTRFIILYQPLLRF
jgi:hypothetical protein